MHMDLYALASAPKENPFEWSILGQLSLVMYAYASAAYRGDWDAIALGIGFSAVEFMWEMLNALVLHFSHRAPLWAIAGKSTYVIYVGLNMEISLMFAMLPIVLFLFLPKDRSQRLLGLPNRLLIPSVLGVFCVLVEIGLNKMGVLLWAWPFWRWPHVWLILVAYCGPCIALVWLYDHLSLRRKIHGMLIALFAAAGCHLLFGGYLDWI